MKVRVFKKYINKDKDLKQIIIEDIDEICKIKKSLKTDLCNFFKRIRQREYNHIHRDKINESVKKTLKKRYHNDEEYRKKRLEQITANYFKKVDGPRRAYEFVNLKL